MIQEKQVNGVNVDQLFETIDLIRNDPRLGHFVFRTENTWVDGTHNRATVNGFYGFGQEDTSRTPVQFEVDEPTVLCGHNLGANPVEYLLVALSGCLTTTLIAHAAAKGIVVEQVRSRYEGDIDLRGFLGIANDVPAGYREIRVFFTIEAPISDAQKRELVAMAQKYSPVFNSLAGPVPVQVDLEAV